MPFTGISFVKKLLANNSVKIVDIHKILRSTRDSIIAYWNLGHKHNCNIWKGGKSGRGKCPTQTGRGRTVRAGRCPCRETSGGGNVLHPLCSCTKGLIAWSQNRKRFLWCCCSNEHWLRKQRNKQMALKKSRRLTNRNVSYYSTGGRKKPETEQRSQQNTSATRGNKYKLLNHTFHYNFRKFSFCCTYRKYME